MTPRRPLPARSAFGGADGSGATLAVLDGFGNNSTTMQAGAARPSFASGTGSGAYLGTAKGNTATSDVVRNAVKFDFTDVIADYGSGIFSFGVFGGDLETGAPGSPSGFLRLVFTDNSTQDIVYAPDPTLFPNASFSGTGDNQSETYGNETGRFIGFVSDTLSVKEAFFVVGDDDLDDNGGSEQLSFIAPIFFVNNGQPVVPNPDLVPEPATLGLLAGVSAIALRRRGRR